MHARLVRKLTAKRSLNPARRHRSYPRVVKRARHNSWRVKRATDVGRKHPGPPALAIQGIKPLIPASAPMSTRPPATTHQLAA